MYLTQGPQKQAEGLRERVLEYVSLVGYRVGDPARKHPVIEIL
jgi:hypothetical protein